MMISDDEFMAVWHETASLSLSLFANYYLFAFIYIYCYYSHVRAGMRMCLRI